MNPKHKTMNVSMENYQRLQRCGFGGESMNDVVERVLSIAEPQIHQRLARYQEDYQNQVAEDLSKQRQETGDHK